MNSPSPQSRPSIRRGSLLPVALATGLGATVRLLPVALHTFPLNDGGLFYAMARDIAATGYRVPFFTSYNGGHIPFAYPPLGPYVLALLQALPVPALAWQRVLPALMSILSIPAFGLLARRLLPSVKSVSVALIAFALVPSTYEWMIMGGGVTRAPAYLLAILALAQWLGFLEDRRRGQLLRSGLLLSAVCLLHLELAWFAACSFLVLVVFRRRQWRDIGWFAAVMFGVAVLTSAWWLPVILAHGVKPFIAAAATSEHSLYSWMAPLFNMTGEPFLSVFAVLGALGLFRCLGQRQFLLPAWFLLTYLIDPRGGGAVASISLALLVAVFVAEPVDWVSQHESEERWTRRSSVGVAALAAYGTFAAVFGPMTSTSPLQVLRPGESQGIEWIATHSSPTSRLAIVSSRSQWQVDPLSEWSPALTGRVSVATVQGTEWTGRMAEAVENHRELQLCGREGVTCLERWYCSRGGFTHVVVSLYPPSSRLHSTSLQESLRASAQYSLVFANSEIEVFVRLAAPTNGSDHACRQRDS